LNLRPACGSLVWMTIRNAALRTGVRLTHLSRPTMIGAGLLTGGAVVALAHLAGADVRGLSGGQSGLLPFLLPEASHGEPQR
jgi:hypothetical protein